MKLIRFGEPGDEKPGLWIDNARRIDASAFGEDYDEAFFGSDGLERLKTWAGQNAAEAPPVSDDVRWAPCICRPSKIICAGLNYRDHAEESGMPIPDEPILFSKSVSSFCGPYDPVEIPSGSEKTDWEVELAIIVGRQAKNVTEADAMLHVAGYAVMNDYSERAWQLERGGQWLKGKGYDSFAPVGPFLTTADEIPDPADLKLWLEVNGRRMQDGHTGQMIFGVATLVSYISQFMTLLPGDIISTGTPPGVGMGIKPTPVYLQPGDVVDLGIDGLGCQRQVAQAAR